MSNWLIFGLGFLAQLLFSGRMVLQWILSEKSKKIITPVLFWWLSIIASFLLFVYGYLRDDFAIMFGQAITYFIYIRNLQLQGEWKRIPKALQIFLYAFPVIIVIYGFNNNIYNAERLFRNEDIPFWLLMLGSVAQLIFTLRFVYQWIYSEKKKISSLPIGFWILSMIGSALILTYGIIRRDPVLITGHVMGLIMYVRNIVIQKNEIKG